MKRNRVLVVSGDVVTAYGWGEDALWNGLLSGKTAIRKFHRFPTDSFQTNKAAVVPLLPAKGRSDDSIVMQMIKPLMNKARAGIPKDAQLILASMTGEIDLLEKAILDKSLNVNVIILTNLLRKVREFIGMKQSGMVVSAACASASFAVARGAEMIQGGSQDCVLVVSCDTVNEFLISGFSSLMALDPDSARPFDRDRKGLSAGEAAGYVLLMNEERAEREKRTAIGEVVGWGMSNDAIHMTAPSRKGDGMILAVNQALKTAHVRPGAIGCVSAHGTGTVYNDAMEILAYQRIFHGKKIPVYSIKGGTGHEMGACGIVEMIAALRSLREKVILPTVNVRNIDKTAMGMVSKSLRDLKKPLILMVNAGFGGINAALVLAGNKRRP